MKEIRNIFIKETSENLTVVEDQLNIPKGQLLSDEAVEIIIRAMHNIKGIAPMVGFNQMSKIAVPVEQTFKQVKMNKVMVDMMLLDKTKDAVTVIKELLFNDDAHTPQTMEEQKVLISFFENIKG